MLTWRVVCQETILAESNGQKSLVLVSSRMFCCPDAAKASLSFGNEEPLQFWN